MLSMLATMQANNLIVSLTTGSLNVNLSLNTLAEMMFVVDVLPLK
jgi:hypothetical protein